MNFRNQPKSFYLFLSLLTGLVLFPLAMRSETTQFVFRAVFATTVLGGVFAISDNRRDLYIGGMMGAPPLLANAVLFVHPSHAMTLTSMFFGAAFFIYLVGTLMRHILRDHEVTLDTIYCATTIYMLIAVVFAALYVMVEFVFPGSFRGEFHPNRFFNMPFADGFYFSVCTLTTLGYGDILPVGAEARSLAMLEGAIGVLYPAILISRLVGLHTANASVRRQPPGDSPPPVPDQSSDYP